ncbi:MAG: DegT/DnrJ/EryC1/StrS family aminotransferase [Candidatus Acidiferrales bacterium]
MSRTPVRPYGARFDSFPLTSFSPYIAYSFHPAGSLGTAGGGGAVTTSGESIAASVRLLRDGRPRAAALHAAVRIAGRLEEIQACLLRTFLRRLAEQNASRDCSARPGGLPHAERPRAKFSRCPCAPA